jgi:hypothetical protein
MFWKAQSWNTGYWISNSFGNSYVDVDVTGERSCMVSDVFYVNCISSKGTFPRLPGSNWERIAVDYNRSFLIDPSRVLYYAYVDPTISIARINSDAAFSSAWAKIDVALFRFVAASTSILH